MSVCGNSVRKNRREMDEIRELECELSAEVVVPRNYLKIAGIVNLSADFTS